MIESIPKTVGMVYAVLGSLLVVVLSRRGRLDRRIGYIFLFISILLGFLVFAPMLPNQFQFLLLGKTGQLGAPIPLAITVLLFFVVTAFLFGRAFCGYVCPIGALQELIYRLPGRKFRIKNKAIPLTFRLLSLVVFLVLSLGVSISVLHYLGVRDFFHVTVASSFFFVFLAVLIAAVFVYRPFCRFLCPYGVLLSLAGTRSLLKLRRNDRCVECGKCEKVCPTNEAGKSDMKQECYLCNRCKEVCPLGAIEYGREKEPQPDRVRDKRQSVPEV